MMVCERFDYILLRMEVEIMRKKLSVIMPVYNREQFVTEAIMSILKQTYVDFELLIIDDALLIKLLKTSLRLRMKG